MKSPLLLVALAASVLASCSSVEKMSGNSPIVDTQGIDIAAYQGDLQDCEAYADQVQVGRQAAAGAATGAVLGGVVGAILGNSDTAERVAGAGAASGAVSGTGRGIRERQQVVKNCLAGRGYRVLN